MALRSSLQMNFYFFYLPVINSSLNVMISSKRFHAEVTDGITYVRSTTFLIKMRKENSISSTRVLLSQEKKKFQETFSTGDAADRNTE